MASSEEVFLCGRCNDFEATTLDDFVTHMSKCVAPESKKKDEINRVECDVEIVLDDSENCGDTIEDTESPQKEKHFKNTVVSSQFQYHNPSSGDGRTSPLLFIWSKQTAEFLFELIKSHKKDLQSTNVRRRVVWQRIAREMDEKYGFCVSATQCENKFKSMTKRYRQTKEYNSNPDRKFKQTCFLYNELDEYFQNDVRFQIMKEIKSNSKRKDLMSESIRKDSKSDSSMKHRKSLGTSKYIDFYHARIRREQVHISEGEDSNNYKLLYQNGTEHENSHQMETEDEISHQHETEHEKSQQHETEHETSHQNETEHEKSHQNETEPLFVKRMMETFEKCHRESMKMQREFINELKKILEKS